MQQPVRIRDLAGFLGVLREETGLDLTEELAHADLADVPAWDSVHLLRLIMAMEEETGTGIPVAAVLEARTMADIHALVVHGGAVQ